MLYKKIIGLVAALACVFSSFAAVSAAEVDSDAIYCFTQRDFSEENLAGVCITALPDSKTGTVMLGTRILRPGDILTAEQLSQVTFCPLRTEEDGAASVSYLPIYENLVAPEATVTIAIRGKEDKAPVAEDTALETYKNLPIDGTLKVKDPEGQPLTYTVTRQPRRGTVAVKEDGTFTYAPKKNKVGVDSFTFTATDPAGNVSREATVTVTILKPASAVQYTDTVGKDCRFAAEWMKNTGIFVGESVAENACFSPEKTVTRGEFVTMLVRALEIPTDEALTYTGYTDEIPTWFKPYLAAAVRSGLTAGLPDATVFGAEEPITGAEAAVMLQNALDLAAQEEVLIGGTEAFPVWASDALAVMQSNGFDMRAEALNRGQVAVMLYQATLLADDAPGMAVIRMQN